MSSFFHMIASSFSTNTSKKLLEDIFISRYELHPKFQPLELKRILQEKSGINLFVKQLSTADYIPSSMSSPEISQTHRKKAMFLALKKISTFHHLVIYYHEFTDLIENIQFEKLIEKLGNCWFVNQVIKPYICFIKRYCLGIEMYQKLRSMPVGSRETMFQCMCYAINMLKSLFNVVSKLASIGRYFRQSFPKTVDYFVESIAYHSQLIYQGFRACVSEIISFSKEHLAKKQYENIFKEILSVDLPWINEEMKKLFLDKYFYPYGKGYGVKLYRFEDQNEYQTQVINGIMNDHQDTQRQKQAKMMEETLFPSNFANKFNCQDLERSFSFSLSKLQYLRKEKKKIQNPEKEVTWTPKKKLNYTQTRIQSQNKKRMADFTSVKADFEEEFVEDV